MCEVAIFAVHVVESDGTVEKALLFPESGFREEREVAEGLVVRLLEFQEIGEKGIVVGEGRLSF